MTISVLIVDDQPLIRSAIAALLSDEPEMSVVGEAGDGEEAVRLTRELHPSVVLMDVRMRGMDGVAATAAIRADPELDGCRVVALTTFEEADVLAACLRAGVDGFIGKGSRAVFMIEGIRAVAAGESLLSPRATALFLKAREQTAGVAPQQRDELGALTNREREVVALMATGMTDEAISARLTISIATTKTHVNRAMAKADTRTRTALVAMAYRTGLAPARRDR
ncbi:MAG: response regulator transcription factor [Microbacterium sp.]